MNAVPLPPVFDAKRLDAAFDQLRSPWKVAAFTAAKMPLGAAAGLRVDSIERASCVTSLPGGWRTQNPFKSMFWAAQGMAAELSTGVHPMMAIQAAPAKVSMILAGCEGRFVKRCTTRARFVFEQGDQVFAAIGETLSTGERVELPLQTVGYNTDGEVVSEWTFTWSFRARR